MLRKNAVILIWDTLRVIFPVMSAFLDRESRTRTMAHAVSESEIATVLAEYSITRDVLPTEFGGTVEFNQSKWVAQRRAVEMEEI